MRWTRDHPTAACSKCGKTVKGGLLLGHEGVQEYCYRCGTNRELAWAHKINRQLTMPRF